MLICHFLARKIPARDMSVFCRQFASILKAGVSVINALEMLGEQTENKRLKEAIERTQSSVEKGENLSDSMRENEEFPSILVDMIKNTCKLPAEYTHISCRYFPWAKK